MGKWLDAVRQKSEMGGDTDPTKPTKAPSVGSVGLSSPGNPGKREKAEPPFVGSVSAPSSPFGENEPEAPCPACNGARWWQDRNGGWWCERCQPFQSGQWARLVELPEGERSSPAPVTEEEVEAAVAVAEGYGWDRETFRLWCGGDWSALPEPHLLKGMMALMGPLPARREEPERAEQRQKTGESDR